MTTIKDLEMSIESAEDALTFVKDELAGLKANLQELKKQDKQPEQESLLGRWATHPKYGRGIITDVEPDTAGDIEFAFPDNTDRDTRTSSVMVEVCDLDLDPATLTTAKDFDNAPPRTIVEDIKAPYDVYIKLGAVWWRLGDSEGQLSDAMPTCRVIRWGNGQ